MESIFARKDNGISRTEQEDYTANMDSVRFGRVLGIGARLAGKTIVAAVDAATSPDPSTRAPAGIPELGVRPAPQKAPVILLGREASVRAVHQARAASQGVRRGSKRFGEAVWGPVARASGVLWLEVTGVFFGLVALVGFDGVWLNRGALHWAASSREMHLHFLIGAGVAFLFGYFCWSSFARAARRSRLNR